MPRLLVVRLNAFSLETREPLLHCTYGFGGMAYPLLKFASNAKWRP